MGELFLSNSIVFLIDGQCLYCENTVEEIKKELKENNRVVLILSEYDGQELPVHKQFIRNYYSSD